MLSELGVKRERTAIRRRDVSRPIRLALSDGLINSGTNVFDYGCGHGVDVHLLQQLGISCTGWDPVFSPTSTKTTADVVNLGYVINVIEDPVERAAVLQEAWQLATQLLIVSARLVFDSTSESSALFGDGYLTSRSTFQKLFEQNELREYIESMTIEPAIAAGPGIFYVFRDATVREAYSAARFTSSRMPTLAFSEALYLQLKQQLEELDRFMREMGRVPHSSECQAVLALERELGSINRAVSILRQKAEAPLWEAAAKERSQDIEVYLALSRFPKRCPPSQLPESIQRDIKAFFGTHRKACESADSLLFSAGKQEIINQACKRSSVGKCTPEALYVHESALRYLPPVLRVYEGCARVLIGRVEGGNIIKLHSLKPSISYLSYPDFDAKAHPALSGSLKVDLRNLRAQYRDYASSGNRPILHRKEEFVAPEFPSRQKFARLTTQEESLGLFESPTSIGYENSWNELLIAKGLKIAGHRVLHC